MSDFGFPAIITVAMFGIITMAYNNLEYKGYPSISSCTGECYEEYLKEHGNILEQLEQKKQEAATDAEQSPDMPMSYQGADNLMPIWQRCIRYQPAHSRDDHHDF